MHAAVLQSDAGVAGATAIRFAQVVLSNSFFGIRALPDSWESALADWISGVPSSEILKNRKGHDANRLQVFLQDAVSFKLVWAAEAVRVQALAMAHPRAAELGEGPALALTYGVASQPAALLCQMGLASRTAAVWAVEQTQAHFIDSLGGRIWLSRHEQLLNRRDFWTTDDHHLLWSRFASKADTDRPREWKHLQFISDVQWTHGNPPPNAFLRMIPKSDGIGLVCDDRLRPLGKVLLPFDCTNWHTEATMMNDAKISLSLYGPTNYAAN
jgi:hypothetical protein